MSYALTLDLSRNDGAKDGHTRAITLQHLDDQLLSVPPRLNVALATIKSLEQLYQSLHARGLFSDASYQRWADRMSYQRTQIEGYLKSFLMLETKVQRILNLVSPNTRKAYHI